MDRKERAAKKSKRFRERRKEEFNKLRAFYIFALNNNRAMVDAFEAVYSASDDAAENMSTLRHISPQTVPIQQNNVPHQAITVPQDEPPQTISVLQEEPPQPIPVLQDEHPQPLPIQDDEPLQALPALQNSLPLEDMFQHDLSWLSDFPDTNLPSLDALPNPDWFMDLDLSLFD
ncbi:Hypothetical predicted protein [Paramuricea clavata]|uniref:Uncharacterized protein n=1 Tax=Paramuricea clavata TaxID=317549 RepID=A0A7D9K8L7_PARCT|nr:Hypothetical predicted protein [Paramuricea clavata]